MPIIKTASLYTFVFSSTLILSACGGGVNSSSGVSSSIANSSSSIVTSSSSVSSQASTCTGAPEPSPQTVGWSGIGAAPTGPYSITVEQDPTLSEHTIYRPSELTGETFPVVVWGNGACSANGTAFAEFLVELASYGYVIIASGAPSGGGSVPQDGSTLISAIDWMDSQSTNACSRFHGNVNMDKVAAMGQSCGGLMALNAGGDSRLSTVVAWNSGLLNQNQNVYAALHTPVAYFNGGPSDIAHENGNRDFQSINNVPVYKADLPVGHSGTYEQDNGGEFSEVGVAWLNWQLKDDQSATGQGMFLGNNCGICNSDWVIESKNF